MRRSLVFLVPACVFVLSSCFWDKSETPLAGSGATAQGTGVTASGQLANFDLTEENIRTQVATSSGHTRLVDRRLFVMNLAKYAREKATSVADLFREFAKIESVAKDNGITLSKEDVSVIVAGLNNEASKFGLCGRFSAEKSSLDKNSPFYTNLSAYCEGPASPKTESSKGK